MRKINQVRLYLGVLLLGFICIFILQPYFVTKSNFLTVREKGQYRINAGAKGCNLSERQTILSTKQEKYQVINNYILSDFTPECNESITFATQSEFSYLDNLEVVVSRWQGPVSVSIFTPGDDFTSALNATFYHRNCIKSDLIKNWVTFHFFYPFEHPPKAGIISQGQLANMSLNCDDLRAWIKSPFRESYKKRNKLDYPINVARNIARENANTHFVYVVDIELYPSPGLISSFLSMMRRNDTALTTSNKPRVFVTPVFEIEKGVALPQNKSQLVHLLNTKKVFVFHEKFCAACHTIPKFDEWLKLPGTDQMEISVVSKRQKPMKYWEPIFIGTNQDPFYDERLSWDGRQDKMTQSYQMCLMDYDFMVLNNAFLIHKPGIKTPRDNTRLTEILKVSAQQRFIHDVVNPEIEAIYGRRNEC